jgi:hypothetical protein
MNGYPPHYEEGTASINKITIFCMLYDVFFLVWKIGTGHFKICGNRLVINNGFKIHCINLALFLYYLNPLGKVNPRFEAQIAFKRLIHRTRSR